MLRLLVRPLDRAEPGLEFYISQNGGLTYAISPDAGAGIWDGNWHFVVGTYDGLNVRLYVDGKQVGNGTPVDGLDRIRPV